MTRIIKSLGILAVVGAIVIGVTVAYFSDTETSAGNTITSGALNLQLECPAGQITDTVSLHPDDGRDTTGRPWGYGGPGPGDYTLNATDLAKLAASEDSRYQTQYGWYNGYLEGTDTEPFEFVNFGIPTVPTGATINSVMLNFEWQRGSGVNGARLKIYNGSSWLTPIVLALPTVGSDQTEIIDLKALGVDTAADIAALRIQFQAKQSGDYNAYDNNARTWHDLVQVDVNYTVTGQPYWCEDGLIGTFVVSNIKPTDVGPEPRLNTKMPEALAENYLFRPVVSLKMKIPAIHRKLLRVIQQTQLVNWASICT